MSEIEEKLNRIRNLKSTKNLSEEDKKFFEFFNLFKKISENENCEDGDCDEILCPECSGKFDTVFGTAPLKVKCLDCKKEYILKELLTI